MTEGQSKDNPLSNELKKIFLYNFHHKNNAKFVPFADYSMPINYELGILKEHLHVRSSAGIFDVSHMGQILITPTLANIAAMEKYIPLNLNNLKINKSYYSFLLNSNGGIIDDLIISKISYLDNIYYFIVYNSSRKKIDEKIFEENLTDYKLLNMNSLIALQGPKSKKILDTLFNLGEIYFMENKVINFLNNFIIISRSGYTGEDGFEVSVPNEISLEFINLLLSNNHTKLCGLGCRDSLRLEAGLSLYGNELNENTSPIEAKLKWAMSKERITDPNLNGQITIVNQIKNGTKKIKVGLQPVSKVILRSNMKLFDDKKNEIGFITSGGFSPTLKSSIGIGYINSFVVNKNKIYCLIRGAIEELKIVKLPFVNHKYKKGSI